jgi:hypothetical protein
MSHYTGYACWMAIWETSYQVLEELEVDGYRVCKISWGFREDWRCDCEEFLTIKPQSMKAGCEHVEKAAMRRFGPLAKLLHKANEQYARKVKNADTHDADLGRDCRRRCVWNLRDFGRI